MKQKTVDELVAAANRLGLSVRLSEHRSPQMKKPVPCVELDGHGSLAAAVLDIAAHPGFTPEDRSRLLSDLLKIRRIPQNGKTRSGSCYYCYY